MLRTPYLDSSKPHSHYGCMLELETAVKSLDSMMLSKEPNSKSGLAWSMSLFGVLLVHVCVKAEVADVHGTV